MRLEGIMRLNGGVVKYGVDLQWEWIWEGGMDSEWSGIGVKPGLDLDCE